MGEIQILENERKKRLKETGKVSPKLLDGIDKLKAKAKDISVDNQKIRDGLFRIKTVFDDETSLLCVPNIDVETMKKAEIASKKFNECADEMQAMIFKLSGPSGKYGASAGMSY